MTIGIGFELLMTSSDYFLQSYAIDDMKIDTPKREKIFARMEEENRMNNRE